MKWTYLCFMLMLVLIIPFSGCSFNRTSTIQPGKEVIKKPGSINPPKEKECFFDVKQKYDIYKQIIELQPGGERTYEFKVINKNKSMGISFDAYPLDNVVSIEPPDFSASPGQETYFKVKFKMPNVPTGTEVTFKFKVSARCSSYPSIVIFKVKSWIPYQLDLLSTTADSLQKGKSVTYTYQIKNNSVDPDRSGYLSFSSPTKNISVPNPLTVKSGSTVKFNITLTMPIYAKVNTTIAFIFVMKYGYYEDVNNLIYVHPDYKETFDILALQ